MLVEESAIWRYSAWYSTYQLINYRPVTLPIPTGLLEVAGVRNSAWKHVRSTQRNMSLDYHVMSHFFVLENDQKSRRDIETLLE